MNFLPLKIVCVKLHPWPTGSSPVSCSCTEPFSVSDHDECVKEILPRSFFWWKLSGSRDVLISVSSDKLLSLTSRLDLRRIIPTCGDAAIVYESIVSLSQTSIIYKPTLSTNEHKDFALTNPFHLIIMEF